MTSTSPIGVVLVDDHDMITESLARMLGYEPDIEVLGIACSSQDAVTLVNSTQPDVAVVDYRLPDADGVETAEGIHAVSPRTRIIILTGFGNSDQIISSAIRAGCVGYLTKDKAVSELVVAIRTVFSDEAYLSTRFLLRVLSRPGNDYPGLGSALSAREREVLQLMANGRANKEIASLLSLSLHTVRNHVQSILLKLDVHSKLEAVTVAYREDLVEVFK